MIHNAQLDNDGPIIGHPNHRVSFINNLTIDEDTTYIGDTSYWGHLVLIVNYKPIFDKDFGDQCQWLDTESGHQPFVLITDSELRAHPMWPAPAKQMQFHRHTAVAGPELVSRIESAMGHVMAENREKLGENWGWKSNSVSVKVLRDYPDKPPTIKPDFVLVYENSFPDTTFKTDDRNEIQLTCEWMESELEINETFTSLIAKTVQRAMRDLASPNQHCAGIRVLRMPNSNDIGTIGVSYTESGENAR